jgi:hypothetical protein
MLLCVVVWMPGAAAHTLQTVVTAVIAVTVGPDNVMSVAVMMVQFSVMVDSAGRNDALLDAMMAALTAAATMVGNVVVVTAVPPHRSWM